MKRCFFYFTILSLCLALHAQQTGNIFYYSQGEKVFLTERADIMFIKLKKDFDKQNLLSFIRTDETVNLNTLDKEENAVCDITFQNGGIVYANNVQFINN